MEEIRVHGSIDPTNPGMVRGRELAREAITSAVYDVPNTPGVGIGTAAAEALLPFLVGGDKNVLAGFIAEMRVWADIAIQLAASGHGVPIENIVDTIKRAIAQVDEA